jgi:hypothetical protein
MALADLIDIESFEVLRGPQGTPLWPQHLGRGGQCPARASPASPLRRSPNCRLGNYGYNQLRLSTTGPLVDGLLAFRLTAFNTDRNGVLDNIKTGVSANSVGRSGARLQLLATPTEAITARFIAEYSQQDDTCCVGVLTGVIPGSLGGAGTQRTLNALAALGYVPPGTTEFTQNNSIQNMRTDQDALSLQVDWDLGWADLTSITGYRHWHFDPLQDSDGTPLDIIQVNVARTHTWQYSQEVRLASKPGRFNWQAGAYAFHQRLKDSFILNQFGYDAGAFYTALNRQTNPNAPEVIIEPGVAVSWRHAFKLDVLGLVRPGELRSHRQADPDRRPALHRGQAHRDHRHLDQRDALHPDLDHVQLRHRGRRRQPLLPAQRLLQADAGQHALCVLFHGLQGGRPEPQLRRFGRLAPDRRSRGGDELGDRIEEPVLRPATDPERQRLLDRAGRAAGQYRNTWQALVPGQCGRRPLTRGGRSRAATTSRRT